MRLTDEERQAIRLAVAEVYGRTAIVRLFGSRVHDHLRGGDIDLHIEVDAGESRRLDDLWWRLQELLGEQRIDIVETVRDRELKPIEVVAYRDGVAV